MRSLATLTLFACCISGCAGSASQTFAPKLPPPMALSHVDVVQNGTNPVHWRRFAPNDPDTYHTGMVAGPDGAMWFTDSGRGLYRIDMAGNPTLYPLHFTHDGQTYKFDPAYLTVGPDGKFYMDAVDGMRIGVFSPPDNLTVYHLSDETQVSGLGFGPDGNLWIPGLTTLIRLTPSGQATYFKYPSDAQSNIFSGVTTGPDGNVWFTTIEPYQVANINPTTLQITAYSLSGIDCQPEGIAVGGDANIYVGCPRGLVRVTTTGTISAINYKPGAITSPGAFVAGPDGDIYFATFVNEPILGHLDVATGVATSIGLPFTGATGIASTAAGPDGNIWNVDGQGYVDVYVRNILNAKPATLTLAPGGTSTVRATYLGSAALHAVSLNGHVATAAASIDKDAFVITGHSTGSTTIGIFDGLGNSFYIHVNVNAT